MFAADLPPLALVCVELSVFDVLAVFVVALRVELRVLSVLVIERFALSVFVVF